MGSTKFHSHTLRTLALSSSIDTQICKISFSDDFFKSAVDLRFPTSNFNLKNGYYRFKKTKEINSIKFK